MALFGSLKKFIGIRHLQVLWLAMLTFSDVLYIEAMRSAVLLVRTGSGYAPQGKFADTVKQFNDEDEPFIELVGYMMLAVGRTLAPFLFIPLNNKYLLLGTLVFEVGLHWFRDLLLVQLKHYGFMIYVSLIMLCLSIHYPTSINIIAKWLPPNEYTRACLILAAGDKFARCLVNLVTYSFQNFMLPMLISTMFLKIAWCISYFVIGAESPQTSFLIRSEEWDYLCKKIGPRRKVDCTLRIPWKSILSTPVLYGLMMSEIAFKWFFLISLELRAYCSEVNHFGLDISMIFQPLLPFLMAWLTDFLISNLFLSANNARKIWNTITLWGIAFCLAFVCYFHMNADTVTFFLGLAVHIGGFYDIGTMATVYDLSPNYAAVIFCVYMIPSWGSVAARAYLDRDYGKGGTTTKSLPVFYRAAIMLYVMNYGLLMSGNIGLRKFDSYDTVDWRRESVMSYP